MYYILNVNSDINFESGKNILVFFILFCLYISIYIYIYILVYWIYRPILKI